MPNSALTPGSEFRSTQILERLLQHRDDWEEIKDIIDKGCWYPLEKYLDEENRCSDIQAMIARGNCRSTASRES